MLASYFLLIVMALQNVPTPVIQVVYFSDKKVCEATLLEIQAGLTGNAQISGHCFPTGTGS